MPDSKVASKAIQPNRNKSNHKRHQKKDAPLGKGDAVNKIKKRKRDIERLLSHHEKLPSDIRVQNERKLHAMNDDLESARQEAKRSKMIGRYHKIRFFERKKADRFLQQAKKKLTNASSPEEQDKWKIIVHKYDVDLKYSMYFPLDQPYVSLYPKEREREELDVVTRREQLPLWATVEECMANSNLEQLKEGTFTRSPGFGNHEQKQQDSGGLTQQSDRAVKKNEYLSTRSIKKDGVSSHIEKHGAGEDGSDEDGGGFFE